VSHGRGEELPFPDASFDAALAQLVVHFMDDPVKGVSEMARVARPGGVVAACIWDSRRLPPGWPFWPIMRMLFPHISSERRRRPGPIRLAEVFDAAGLREVEERALPVTGRYETFDEWWESVVGGVGHGGNMARRLDPEQQAEVRDRCREALPPAPFELTTSSVAVVARVPENPRFRPRKRGVKVVSPDNLREGKRG